MMLKIGNLLSLLLAEAWFIGSLDWEPAILFIGLLAGLIAQEYKDINLNKKLSKKEKLESLYIKIHAMMEELIKTTKMHKETDLNSRFSQLAAEVKMMATQQITEKYHSVLDLYYDWASIYIKAYPKPKNGIQILYSKNADPTREYKIREEETFEKFYAEYEHLIETMYSEIQSK